VISDTPLGREVGWQDCCVAGIPLRSPPYCFVVELLTIREPAVFTVFLLAKEVARAWFYFYWLLPVVPFLTRSKSLLLCRHQPLLLLRHCNSASSGTICHDRLIPALDLTSSGSEPSCLHIMYVSFASSGH